MSRTNDGCFTARIPKEMYEELRKVADQEERSPAATLRRALREYLERRREEQ